MPEPTSLILLDNQPSPGPATPQGGDVDTPAQPVLVGTKQDELFRMQSSQDWTAIEDDDLPVDDTWVVVRDNEAYHTVNRFHPYFAMCPPPLARQAVAEYSQPGDLVLDPFCGAGVTLIESMILGRASLGVDVLSIARFISKVKTTVVDIALDDALRVADRAVELFASHDLTVDLSRIYNVDYWFSPHSQRQLAAMLAAVAEEPDSHKRDFYRLAISGVVRPISNSGNLESHLHVKAGKTVPDGFKLFRLRLLDMVNREKAFRRLLPQGPPPASVHAGDSRDRRHDIRGYNLRRASVERRGTDPELPRRPGPVPRTPRA